MLNLESVLVTGTDRGLGLEFVKQFLKLQTPPKYVFAGCLDLENAPEVKQLTLEHKNLRVLQLDVTDDDSIEAARVLVESQVGDSGLNLLLNNAAINNQKDGLEPLTRADMTDHFNTNIIGPMMIVKTFHPLLMKASTSSADVAIVNITSGRGIIDFAVLQKDFRYPYCSSKSGLIMATVILANEMRPFGIPVVSMCPGWVKTVMGGPGGRLEVSESTMRCMKIIMSLDMSVTGNMFKYDGTCFNVFT